VVVAWWCQRADRTTVARFWRADWATVTAIAARVVADNNVIWVGDGKDADTLGEFHMLLGPPMLTHMSNHFPRSANRNVPDQSPERRWR
jgi:hypothetical protein